MYCPAAALSPIQAPPLPPLTQSIRPGAEQNPCMGGRGTATRVSPHLSHPCRMQDKDALKKCRLNSRNQSVPCFLMQDLHSYNQIPLLPKSAKGSASG